MTHSMAAMTSEYRDDPYSKRVQEHQAGVRCNTIVLAFVCDQAAGRNAHQVRRMSVIDECLWVIGCVMKRAAAYLPLAS